ncbi:37034_t:CDS:2, partial [Gigaspora margarita]
MNSYNTVFDTKRLIGHRFIDPKVQSDMKYWPFKVIDKNGKPYIQVKFKGKTKQFTPEEILPIVLLKMKKTAKAFLSTKITNA